MTPILQTALPFAPWMDPRTLRLPGVLPVDGEDWLSVDEAYAAQMAERDRLIATAPDVVLGMQAAARPAVDELYAMILHRLHQTPGYIVQAESVQRPDGVWVPLDAANPLQTLGRLVQEDLCLMEAQGEEHVLTAAALCFPASWTLAQKLGRALVGIHKPVPEYDEIALRVQRMFNAIRVGQPLWRMNHMVYDDATLHQPRVEGARRPRPVAGRYVRCERQTFVRLPETRAVLFAIHTYVVPVANLTVAERAGLKAAGHHPEE